MTSGGQDGLVHAKVFQSMLVHAEEEPKLIWIQGVVVEISGDRNLIAVDDGTAVLNYLYRADESIVRQTLRHLKVGDYVSLTARVARECSQNCDALLHSLVVLNDHFSEILWLLSVPQVHFQQRHREEAGGAEVPPRCIIDLA